MTFNTITFLIFFLAVVGLDRLPLPWKIRKFNLVLVSYIFYAAWNAPFALLLLVCTALSFYTVSLMDKAADRRRSFWLWFNVSMNIGLLAYFKYADFALDTFAAMVAPLGVSWQAPEMDIAMPIGVSFYTFQNLTYVLDVFKKRMKAWPSFLDFALYVVFFPKILAGPIVRADEFLPQCKNPPKPDDRRFAWGLSLFVMGLFLKAILADWWFSMPVSVVFSQAAAASTADAWVAALAYSGQIYCDFAGYSLCAIGIALCIGFVLPDNFHFPYASIGFADFWRRWHISLSTWLRDYLYIPLGGSRKTTCRNYFNVIFTMLVCGLWHGSQWTFVVWGGLHGFFIAMERILKKRLGGMKIFTSAFVRPLLALVTFLLVTLAWVFFRSPDFKTAFQLLSAMFGMGPDVASSLVNPFMAIREVVVVAALVIAQWFVRDLEIETVAGRMPWWLRAASLAALIVALLTIRSNAVAFIYFQF